MKIFFLIFGLMTIILLQGCKPMTAPDFQHLKLPQYPNYYLVCPKDFCNVTPNAYTPIYPIAAEDLFAAFNQMVSEQPRANFIYSMPETGQYTLTQKTPLGWIDEISIQFIALPNDQSTLAIISKSRYGFYDFGMNKRRLDSWMLRLGQIVANQASTTPVSQTPTEVPTTPTVSEPPVATTTEPAAATPADQSAVTPAATQPAQ